MTVYEHNLMDDSDEDLNKPLIVRRNSSSSKQNRSNSQTKKSSPVQKHDGKSYNGETSTLKKCICFTKSLIKMMISSIKSPPAQSPLSNSSAKKLPVKSVDANSKNTSSLDGSKPIQQRVKEDAICTVTKSNIKKIISSSKSPLALDVDQGINESTNNASMFENIPEERCESAIGGFRSQDESWKNSGPRLTIRSNYQKSLFGIMADAQKEERRFVLSKNKKYWEPARVYVSCPERADMLGYVELLPRTFRELVEIGKKRFGLMNAKIVSEDGVLFETIHVVRDEDHLVFVRRYNSI